MSRKRKVLLLVAALPCVAAILAMALMLSKDMTYVPSAAYAPQGEPNGEVAVVYYSRSGHSEAAAREIARMLNAPIARIDADYPRDVSGNMKAFNDATESARPPIQVEPIDVSRARRIFLVSPNWESRPAPPLWSYVEQAELAGKEVVLVMTGNNALPAEGVKKFTERVEARGARFAKHIYLQRGRFYWQMSRENLLEETREAVRTLPSASVRQP